MKIENKKLLNQNNYNKVMVDLLGREYKIKFANRDKNKLSTIKNDNPFTDKLFGLQPSEKVLELIKHFLRNSNINELHAKEFLDYYTGWFTTARGANDRLLALKLNDSNLSRRIIELVNSKYLLDRDIYYTRNDVKAIYASSSVMKYGVNLWLRTIDIKDKICIHPEEKEFLYKLIKSKLNYEDEAHIKHFEQNSPTLGYVDYGTYFVCGDTMIKIDSFIIRYEVTKIVNDYNLELKKQNEKQLKLKI